MRTIPNSFWLLLVGFVLLSQFGCESNTTSGNGGTSANCGNGVVEEGEACEPSLMEGAQCSDQGFVSGSLGCTVACAFDVSDCVAAASDVSVSSVSASALTVGQTYEVQGAGFGVKDPVEPLSYDDFETGALGQRLGTAKVGLGWNHQTYSSATGLCDGDPCTSYNDEEVFAGNQSAKTVVENAGLNFFGWVGGGNFSEIYVHYWRYFQPYYSDVHNICNHKQIYIYNSISDSPQWLLGAVLYPGDGWPIAPQGQCTNTFQDVNGYDRSTSVSYPEAEFSESEVNQWKRWEIFIRNDSPSSAQNGAEYFWLNGKLLTGEIEYSRPSYADPNLLVTDRESVNLIADDCATADVFMQDFRIGAMVHNDDPCSSRAGSGEPDVTYLDNLYVDQTRARIQICNVPTWNQKESVGAVCAIQLPTEVWEDGRVKFVANRGGLVGATNYLYVVNADGVANAAGYEVTW